MKDPRIPLVTTVTSIKVTPDLKYAKVFISILDDEDKILEGMKTLKAAAPFIRHALAQKLNLRNTPELTFASDTSMAYGAHISKIINELNIDVGENQENDDDAKKSE
ncbi:MAG: 30S ribosome-binding factor RbfA, partial [Clostridia bacterium]